MSRVAFDLAEDPAMITQRIIREMIEECTVAGKGDGTSGYYRHFPLVFFASK